MAPVLVLELDVLLELSGIAPARRRADWAKVGAQLDCAAPYETAGDALTAVELVRWAQELDVAVGILTDLPGPPAQRLLERFSLEPDALLDASAGQAAPPRPDSLIALAAALGSGVEQVLMVGCKPVHHIAAAQAGATSVGAGWAGAGGEAEADQWPDLAIATPEKALEALGGAGPMRPIAEVLLDGEEPVIHAGSLIGLAGGARACGRYYSATDRRLAGHRLNELIIAAKDDADAAARLGELLAAGAAAAGLGPIDLVASVPVGSLGGSDRFGPARSAVAEAVGARAADLVGMVRAVENYTSLDRDQRRMANQGRFEVKAQLGGERVLLVDDILTSGAQSRACARELLGAGAGEVSVLVAAVSQQPIQRECPRCHDGVMRRITGDYAVFYGCTNFHCHHTERWDG